MSHSPEGNASSPEALVSQLVELATSACESAYPDFEERLELDAVEYGISEETLTSIFLERSDEEKARMLALFTITNLAVAGTYFLGRFNREFVRQSLQQLQVSCIAQFEALLGDDATQPFEMVRRLLREGGFDAYQAGMIAFLSLIGFLEHEDSTKATLDTEFLNGFRMDFAKTIPYLHQAERALKGS